MLTIQIFPAVLNKKNVSFTFSYSTLSNGIVVYHGMAVGFKTFSAAEIAIFQQSVKHFFRFEREGLTNLM